MLKIVPGLLRATAWSTAALLLLGGAAQAAFSDLQFGRYQVADTQWNVSNCQNTTTCDIYSKVPGTAYKIPFSDGEVDWGANSDRYIGFTPNAGANSASYPHEMTLFEADGTVVQSLGAGRVLTAGADAKGDAYFFFVGSDEFTGQLFSGSVGMDSTAGISFTGTLTPTLAELDSFSNGLSTTPLGAGETVSPPPTDPEEEPLPVTSLSVLERVLNATAEMGTMAPLAGTFVNIAENEAWIDPQTGTILNRIDGSVTNTLTGVAAATSEVAGDVQAIGDMTVDIGDMSTTVLGAVNTGTITLGVNQDLSEAISGSSGAVSASIRQLGGTTDQAALVADMASNMTSVIGSVDTSFNGLNGSMGNVSTTVLGAVNTGTVVSGVNSAVTGIVGG
ncbi:hypothetical protein [Tabrizicola sp.]|uniref:hypothetical protein n=1 Tax=Tabrizicola sp. TaxID=2005166 RepID=UPI0035B2BFCF